MHRYLIGIDVGGTNIKIMIMTEELRVFGKRSIPTRHEEGYEAVSDRMIRTLREMFEEAGETQPEVLKVAMGLPGTVDRKGGKAVYLALLHWDGFNPAEKIGKAFDASVVIENDANINALGEYAFGAYRGRDLVLLTLGTGVGCGVISDGRIFGGSRNMAAEFGHTVIVADGGEICLCGRRGHLEAYCSGSALRRDALSLAEERPDCILNRYMQEEGRYDNRMVTRGAGEGDEGCIKLVDRFVHYLSAGVTNVMNCYNPEIVLIGGGISNAGEMILQPLRETCEKMVLSEASFCPIERASLGAEAGMYGACALAAQEAGIDLRGKIHVRHRRVDEFI